MRLLVSCIDNGSLKEIVCNEGTNTSIQTARQPFSLTTHMKRGARNAIDTLSIFTSGTERRLLLARTNGSIELVKMSGASNSFTDPETSEIYKFDTSSFDVLDSISDGLLDDSRLEAVSKKSSKRSRIRDCFVSLQRLPLMSDSFVYVLVSKSGLLHVIKYHEGDDKLEKLGTHELTAPLDFAQVYDNESYKANTDTSDKGFVIAYGGEENLVKLVELQGDFSSVKQIWEAKNVANDRLDLHVPVWPTALKFLDPVPFSSSMDTSKPNYQFVVITHWSHLGIYRTQHGRRPLKYIDLLPKREPLAQLEFVPSGEHNKTELGNLKSSNLDEFVFVTTDLKKNVMKFNEKGRLLGKFGKNDVTGAATFIKVVSGKYLIQGGLDNYVRVFDVQSLRLLCKVYVDSAVNFVEVLDTEDMLSEETLKRSREEREEEEEDPEALWDRLNEGNSGHAKKKSKKE